MEDAAGDTPLASSAAATSKRAPGLRLACAKPPSVPAAVDEPAASAQPGSDDREAAAADPDEEVDDIDVFNGRPDLAQNTIEELRSRHRELKQQQRKVKSQLRNQKRKRARVLKRMRNLDTASVLQVLMDRGIDFSGAGSGGASGASASKCKPAPTASQPSAARSSAPINLSGAAE
jgi:hypothetical protein